MSGTSTSGGSAGTSAARAADQGPSVPALRLGTEAHYRDPALYDHNYARRRYDVKFYVEMAREHGSPILELGAGSGRVSLALAQDGHEVVALDRMEPMLAQLRARLAKSTRAVRARVRVVRGDLLKSRLKQKFPLVIAPFNVFMHLYTRPQVERALATCHAHLAPRGRLVFDVTMPDPRALVRDPHKAYVSRPVVDPRDGKKYRYVEHYQYDPGTQIQMITAVLSDPADPTNMQILPLAHRQFFPAELEALLHYNGFEMLERSGDFERGPLSSDGESQVVVARATRSGPAKSRRR